MKNDNHQPTKEKYENLLTVNPYTCNENVDKFNRTDTTLNIFNVITWASSHIIMLVITSQLKMET